MQRGCIFVRGYSLHRREGENEDPRAGGQIRKIKVFGRSVGYHSFTQAYLVLCLTNARQSLQCAFVPRDSPETHFNVVLTGHWAHASRPRRAKQKAFCSSSVLLNINRVI